MNKALFKRRLSQFGCYAVAVILILFFLLPIYYVFSMSLMHEVDTFAYPPKFIFSPTWDNYIKIFKDGVLSKNLVNSIVISTCCVLLGLIVGTPASYALSRLHNKFVPGLMFFILVVRLIPPMSMLLPIFSMYVKMNLIDTHIGLIILDLTFVLPLNVWMQKTFFDGVPREMEEAAEIDGASTIQTMIQVVIPLIAQAIVATAIFSWIQAWNEYLFSLVITRMNAKTIIMAVNNYITFDEMHWGELAASAVVICLPVLAFSVVVRKYLISGMTAGGVKE